MNPIRKLLTANMRKLYLLTRLYIHLFTVSVVDRVRNRSLSLLSMGSSESLAGTLGVEQVKEKVKEEEEEEEEDEEEGERGKVVKAKVFKSTFAKQLEEKRAPLMREMEKEGESALQKTCFFYSFYCCE